ncbi:hypothetical protein QOK74_08125 [Staphylococcus saprophyticus]|uniref:hypothetical protein n=1 Tax=Staphylococcus saprophyticus TaxID=29385 RepID=UPI0024C26EB4|nr:hypothetical protein [Staphylococcus saprophyticus]MDK1672837.1 hypothetical protein [Staphylococcus saprophyticus]
MNNEKMKDMEERINTMETVLALLILERETDNLKRHEEDELEGFLMNKAYNLQELGQ